MSKQNSLFIMIGGIVVLGVGVILIPPSWHILGIILGILGFIMFAIGAYWTLKSIIISSIGMLKEAKMRDLAPGRRIFSGVFGLAGLGISAYCIVSLISIMAKVPKLIH